MSDRSNSLRSLTFPARRLSRSRLAVFLLPARRDGDVRQTEEPLDAGPFAHIVAFDAMADELQQIAEHKRPDAPVPRHEEQQRDADDRHRDADHVNPEAEWMLMALAPIVDSAAREAQQRARLQWIVCLVHGHHIASTHAPSSVRVIYRRASYDLFSRRGMSDFGV